MVYMPMVTHGIYGIYGTIWYAMVWYHMVYTVPYGICGIYGTYGNLWYI